MSEQLCPTPVHNKLAEEKEIEIQKWNNRVEMLAMCVCGHNEPAHDETAQKFCDAWDCSCPGFQKTPDTDIIFCQNCQKVTGIIDQHNCANCGEMVCLHCGCTESEPCSESCEWTRDGVCSNCEREVVGMQINELISGMKL